MNRQLTATIQREGDGYVALYLELDVASQGETVAESRENLKEALGLFFETASATETQHRLHPEVYAAQLELTLAWTSSLIESRGS